MPSSTRAGPSFLSSPRMTKDCPLVSDGELERIVHAQAVSPREDLGRDHESADRAAASRNSCGAGWRRPPANSTRLVLTEGAVAQDVHAEHTHGLRGCSAGRGRARRPRSPRSRRRRPAATRGARAAPRRRRPGSTISSDAAPGHGVERSEKPRTELSLARRIASTTAMPSAMPATVNADRSCSWRRRRRMNCLKSGTGVRRRPAAIVDAEHVTVPQVDDACRRRRRDRASGWRGGSSARRAALRSASRSSTRAPLSESRFPVGSSATSSAGRCTTARAMAARCSSPPDSCCGKVRQTVGDPDALGERTRAAAALSRGGHARQQQRQRDVLGRG